MAQPTLFPGIVSVTTPGVEDQNELGLRIGVSVEAIRDNSTSSAYAKFLEALMQARIDLFRLVTEARITDIQSTAWKEDPATDDEIARNTSSILEGKMVIKHLYKSLGVQLRDGASAEIRDEWNDIPLFRQLDLSQLDRILAELDNEIDDLLGLIILPPEAPEDDLARAISISPLTTPFRPGDSIWNR